MKAVTVVFLLIQCMRFDISTGEMTLDATLLSKKVKGFLDTTVKREALQTYIWDKLIYREEQFVPKQILDSMVRIFGKRLRARIRALQKLKDAVVRSYGASGSPHQPCCSEFETQFSRQLKQEVATDRSCQVLAPNVPENPVLLSRYFQEVAMQNYKETPSLKWQYFGSEQGVTTIFPGTKLCADYDNRFRPWYSQAIFPDPRQVVIVIDKSKSMGRTHSGQTLLEVAKTATKTIIETLNSHDTLAVLAFANRAESWRKRSEGKACFSQELAQATLQNKKKLSMFVDNLLPAGGSYYQLALDKAFDYFDGSLKLHTKRHNHLADFPTSTIHFISDGSPDDSESTILETLRKRTLQFNYSTTLVAYGVGNDDFTILKNMASINNSKIQRGRFRPLTDLVLFRNQLIDFYKSTSSRNSQSKDPVWSAPYIDYIGLGQVITGSLPVYINNQLVGVAAVDVSLDDLLAETTHFRPNDYSYAFVINQIGHVVKHPLFPHLEDEHSISVSVTAFERDAEFFSVLNAIQDGEAGNKTFVATKFLPYGSSKKRGVVQHRVLSGYYWKPIPYTEFIVCLVMDVNSTKSVLTPQGSLAAGDFLYHRLDILPPQSSCLHLNSLSIKDKTSVFLSWKAFSNVVSGVNLREVVTQEYMENIASYMEGREKNSNLIKDGIKDEVVATYKAQELWLEETKNKTQEQVLWRFLGTSDGVLRIFPGTQLPDAYDPTQTSWYQLAIVHRGMNIITPPYVDAASGAQVISVSSVLFQKRTSNNNIDELQRAKIFGVVAVDLLFSYFHRIFMDMYPACKKQDIFKCVLIDKSGFVVLIEEYISDQNEQHEVKHISEVEPQVTSILIRDGVLERINCSNIESGLLQRSYQVRDNQSSFIGTYGEGYFHLIGFKFFPVPNTNAYLIIRTLTTSQCVGAFVCQCSSLDSFGNGNPSLDSNNGGTASSSSEGDGGLSVSKRSLERMRRNSTSQTTQTFTFATTVGSGGQFSGSGASNSNYLENFKNFPTPQTFVQDTAATPICITTWDDIYCECPCASENPFFSACLNEYNSNSKTSPPCTPQSRVAAPLQHLEDLSSLPKCYNITFEEFFSFNKDSSYTLVAAVCGAGGGVLLLAIMILNNPKVQNAIYNFLHRRDRRERKKKLAMIAMRSLDDKKWSS